MTRAAAAPGGHSPVLLAEVLDVLAPRDGGIYVDGTFGAGGTAEGLLARARCRVWGIDRDPDAIARGRELARRYHGRLALIHGRFGDMGRLLADSGVAAADGVALDLGVSSQQLDRAERGFSFRADGPLDMRMERTGPSAGDLVARTGEEELARLIRDYGEERRARAIARAIVAARQVAPIATTGRLAEIVRKAAGPRGKDGIDPATRTFQALRIAVNDELGELERGLDGAEALLAPGGRLAVISFHSLEDRRVKAFLKQRSGLLPGTSRHLPERRPQRRPTFRMLGRAAVTPGAAEIAANPRARSASLRAAERTAAPAGEGQFQ
jgi:16S rRNA (cytosine1402-N4)-methyltransferase